MADTFSLTDAYLDQAMARFGPSRDSVPHTQAVGESVGQYAGADVQVRQLLYRMVDQAINQADFDPNRVSENDSDWQLTEMARSLGRPLAELQAFLRRETPRLINLKRLMKLTASSDPLNIPEAVVLANRKNQPILAGQSGKFRELLDHLKDVADNPYSVLITGPTGTGKELIALRIHQQSPFSSGPFVPVDCAALPENLMESELFGHEKGAFTGAIRARPGKVEMAVGGTLFLDEIGELPVSLQVKLLRFLQERVVQRVGGQKAIRVNVRVVAATSRDLDKMMAEETFREDLYFRLATLPVTVPALAERLEDLPLLIDHYLTQASLETRKPRRLSNDLKQRLLAYDYPGNVRELINFIRNMVVVSHKHVIDLQDLPTVIKSKLVPLGSQEEIAWRQQLDRLNLQSKVIPALAELLAGLGQGRLSNADLRRVLDCSDSTAKTILNNLTKAGLLKAVGQRGGRRYILNQNLKG